MVVTHPIKGDHMESESYGKCPKCESVLNAIQGGHITINVPLGAKFHGISYTCPSCQIILSVQIDPVALKTDIINELLSKLGRVQV